MKVKRLKHTKRVLAFYKQNFGFIEPFQILLDGTFCMAALKGKIDIIDQIKKYFNSEIKIFTTHCALRELYQIGPQVSGAHKILKKFTKHKCGHENASLEPMECFKAMISSDNPSHYIIGTQDSELHQVLRSCRGIPILYISGSTLYLESPSFQSKKEAKKKFREQDLLTDFEKETLAKMNRNNEDNPKHNRKRKRAKGPNPLSCKKKKSDTKVKKKKTQPIRT